MPNAWDVGSAAVLGVAGLPGAGHDEQRSRGDARAARRSGSAATRRSPMRPRCRRHRPAGVGRSRERVRRRSRRGGRDDRPGAASRSRRLLGRGLLGATRSDPIYELGLARERIVAAAEIAHSGPVRMVLTARAENLIRGRRRPAATRSPAFRPTRRRAPTCCSRPGLTERAGHPTRGRVGGPPGQRAGARRHAEHRRAGRARRGAGVGRRGVRLRRARRAARGGRGAPRPRHLRLPRAHVGRRADRARRVRAVGATTSYCWTAAA